MKVPVPEVASIILGLVGKIQADIRRSGDPYIPAEVSSAMSWLLENEMIDAEYFETFERVNGGK
jgi:hypothetical protein